MTIEVPGRINTKGQVIKPFDAPLLRERIRSLAKHKPDAITISLVNSFANSTHEEEAMRIAKEIFPEGRFSTFLRLICIHLTAESATVPVSISSEVRSQELCLLA